MSHLHRGRFMKARRERDEAARAAVINYVPKAPPAEAHVAMGATPPAVRPARAKRKAKAKRSRK